MKMLRASLLVLACFATPVAFAQWQWIDASGRKVFSDQPPPPGTPNDKILKRPGNRPAEPEPEIVAKPAAAPMPRLSGKEKELEDKRKAASAAEGEKKRAQEEEVAKAKADNCERAKKAKATLDSGIRLTQTNAKGETEIMDDNARAAEAKRLDTAISRNCGA
ncbi:MAG TPA: DUF4124 domain-containing protein [Ramlibacter sp.]|nr:DUF4124 domain-containing protein [Ramlibacter sp.]